MERTKVELGDVSASLTIETSVPTGHVVYTVEVGRLTLSMTLSPADARKIANHTLAAANGRDPEAPRERERR